MQQSYQHLGLLKTSEDFAPIKFEIAYDLSYWTAEIHEKVLAKAEALTGPMTPPGKRVQTINPPGSNVGPGVVATWGKSTVDQVDAMGFKWKRKARSHLYGFCCFRHIAFLIIKFGSNFLSNPQGKNLYTIK